MMGMKCILTITMTAVLRFTHPESKGVVIVMVIDGDDGDGDGVAHHIDTYICHGRRRSVVPSFFSAMAMAMAMTAWGTPHSATERRRPVLGRIGGRSSSSRAASDS